MERQENPSVNRYLNDKAMDRIDHALGRPIWPLRESYRNHFAVSVGSRLSKEFDASPYWEGGREFGQMASYYVTDAGRQALAKHLAELPQQHHAFIVTFGDFSRVMPAETAAKARYAYYLEVSDCFDLKFGEFSKRTTVRRAA